MDREQWPAKTGTGINAETSESAEFTDIEGGLRRRHRLIREEKRLVDSVLPPPTPGVLRKESGIA